MARSVQLPAPGRGAYDRSLSRVERDAQHRERLFFAAAEVSALGPVTVARITAHAGVGRSTFYEFFDSPEHLLEQLEQRVERAITAALDLAFREAHTPLERVRAIARRFVKQLEAHPVESRFALSQRAGGALLSSAALPLHRALQRVAQEARSDGLGWFRATDEASVLGAAGAVETLARRHLSTTPTPDAAKVLADLVIKLLR